MTSEDQVFWSTQLTSVEVISLLYLWAYRLRKTISIVMFWQAIGISHVWSNNQPSMSQTDLPGITSLTISSYNVHDGDLLSTVRNQFTHLLNRLTIK